VFDDLEVGDTFIYFPTPGDNHGQGGFLGGGCVFEKIVPSKTRRVSGVVSYI